MLNSLVKINTESKKSNLPLIYLIKDILDKKGFETKIQKIGNKANLKAKKGKGKGGLLFSGHTDTVSASSNWNTDPFCLTKKGNKYYGLGTVDVKGFLACIITASIESIIKKPLMLNFTFDEEIDFKGVKELLSKNSFSPLLAIIGEPTNMMPVIAHKGVSALKVVLYGKEAHSSDPSLGVNAIERACDFITFLKEIKKEEDSLFTPKQSTICVSKIKGGDAINKVPSYCEIELEQRVIRKKYLNEIKEKIKEIGKVEETFSILPFKSSIKDLKRITNKKPISVSFCTEASLYEKYNIPSIIMGPGDIKRAHRPNEFITEQELKEATLFYKRLIREFCT